MTERKRRVLWTLAIIIAFIIGFLLGRRYCERHMSGGSGGGVILGKGGGGGGGGGGHFAPGSGKGTSKSEGGYLKTPVDTDSSGGGNASPAGGGSSDARGGNGGGNSESPYDSGEFKKKPKAVDTLSAGFVAQLSQDQLTGRAPNGPPPPPSPNITTKTADDFSLDQTALPRFPMDVTTAYSGLSTRSDKPADTGTATVFATSDSYDSVTSWYQHHMPASTHAMSVDASKLAAMAKQLTPKNIMKMFTGSDDSTKTVDSAAADSTVPDRKFTGWTIPDDGVHGQRTVMVVDEPGKPTTILMSRSKRP